MAIRESWIIGSALALLPLGAASAAPLPQGGVFTYSDQCISRESGDIYGYRIVLPRGVGGYIWAVIYVDDEAPVLGFANYDSNTGAIHIEAHYQGTTEQFHIDGVVDTAAFRRGSAAALPAISNSETRPPYCATSG